MQTSDASNFFRAEDDLIKEDARRAKAERTKDVGWPIDLPAKPLAITVRRSEAWIAQSDAVVRRVDLETGKVLQIFRGHTGPVTTVCLWDEGGRKEKPPLLVSGSWDKTVKIWNTERKTVISSTSAHSDFVKCVFPISQLKLLATSGSDRVVRFWDMSNSENPEPLTCIGTLSSHTRPVQCFAVDVHSPTSATLYTADSMGVIFVWHLEREYVSPRCRATETGQLNVHRTGVNDMWYGRGQLWTASSDDSVALQYHPVPSSTPAPKPVPPISHPTAVKALLPLAIPAVSPSLDLVESLTEALEPYLLTAHGDDIRLYDVSAPYEPELVRVADEGHWHDVVALRLWIRRVRSEREATKGHLTLEPWIVSASLDGTIRRWRLADLIKPPPKQEPGAEKPAPQPASIMTEEEERELAELMEE